MVAAEDDDVVGIKVAGKDSDGVAIVVGITDDVVGIKVVGKDSDGVVIVVGITGAEVDVGFVTLGVEDVTEEIGGKVRGGSVMHRLLKSQMPDGMSVPWK
jgi:hypothetical protein